MYKAKLVEKLETDLLPRVWGKGDVDREREGRTSMG